jgi:hypothetical protein
MSNSNNNKETNRGADKSFYVVYDGWLTMLLVVGLVFFALVANESDG